MDFEDKQMGLKDKLFGAMGTKTIVFTPLTMTGPPAERAQAVDPVGVDISIPSPEVVVMYSLSMYIYSIILLQSFRVMATSFSTTLVLTSGPLVIYFLILALSLSSLST